MILCTFVNINPWFDACLKFFMCIKKQFYHVNWLQAFLFFEFSFFKAKNLNHCESYVNF